MHFFFIQHHLIYKAKRIYPMPCPKGATQLNWITFIYIQWPVVKETLFIRMLLSIFLFYVLIYLPSSTGFPVGSIKPRKCWNKIAAIRCPSCSSQLFWGKMLEIFGSIDMKLFPTTPTTGSHKQRRIHTMDLYISSYRLEKILNETILVTLWRKKYNGSPISEEDLRIPRLSLSHLTTAPAIATEPWNVNHIKSH